MDSTETTGRFPQFCCFPMNSASRELGWAPSHSGLALEKDFVTCSRTSRRVCQSREPLSTLRAFLLFFPLASHWCLSKGPFASITFAGAAIHTSHLQAAGVTRDAWGVTKVPALCNTRQISTLIPHVMTLHGNRHLASKTPKDPLRTAQSHTLFAFTISSVSQLKANPMP